MENSEKFKNNHSEFFELPEKYFHARITSNFRALSSADFLVFLINTWLWLSIPSRCNSNIEVLAFRKN